MLIGAHPLAIRCCVPVRGLQSSDVTVLHLVPGAHTGRVPSQCRVSAESVLSQCRVALAIHRRMLLGTHANRRLNWRACNPMLRPIWFPNLGRQGTTSSARPRPAGSGRTTRRPASRWPGSRTISTSRSSTRRSPVQWPGHVLFVLFQLRGAVMIHMFLYFEGVRW